MAKDKQNKRHEPVDENSVTGGGTKTRVITIVAKFSLPQKDIVKLLVQQSGKPQPPHEHSMVSLPAYRVEPPDILKIEMLRMVPLPPYRIGIYDVLQIRAVGVLTDDPIDGFFLVEGEGVVTLGPAYGRVRVAGMTVEQADDVITKKLREMFNKPEVSVQLAKTAGTAPVTGEYLVGPDGTINLRQYGTLHVAGKTVTEIRKELNKHLAQYFDSPDASVEVRQFNSKVFYVITEGGGMGDNIRRVPITGNDTVLDALSAVNVCRRCRARRFGWRVRRRADSGCEQMLPVDYDAITRGASAATNYQIMPGDRVYVADDMIAANSSSNTTAANERHSNDAALNVIRPADVLAIRAVRALPDIPIDGLYPVGPDGTVNLGSAYGRANVNGLSIEQAERKIAAHLTEIAKGQIDEDINVRYATAVAKVAEAEYAQAVEANRKVANPVPEAEVRRRLLELRKAQLSIEKARKDAGPAVLVTLARKGGPGSPDAGKGNERTGR